MLYSNWATVLLRARVAAAASDILRVQHVGDFG